MICDYHEPANNRWLNYYNVPKCLNRIKRNKGSAKFRALISTCWPYRDRTKQDKITEKDNLKRLTEQLKCMNEQNKKMVNEKAKEDVEKI